MMDERHGMKMSTLGAPPYLNYGHTGRENIENKAPTYPQDISAIFNCLKKRSSLG